MRVRGSTWKFYSGVGVRRYWAPCSYRSLLLRPSLLSSLALLLALCQLRSCHRQFCSIRTAQSNFRSCFTRFARTSGCQLCHFRLNGPVRGLRTTCSETWTARTRGALPAQCKHLLFQAKVDFLVAGWIRRCGQGLRVGLLWFWCSCVRFRF